MGGGGQGKNKNINKINIKNCKLRIAAINIIRLNILGQRQVIEKWMEGRKIDIVALQETKIRTNAQERRQKYTWYFSVLTGEEKGEEGKNKGKGENRFDTGVGLIINSKLKKYIGKIYHHNDRIIGTEIEASLKINFSSICTNSSGR